MPLSLITSATQDASTSICGSGTRRRGTRGARLRRRSRPAHSFANVSWPALERKDSSVIKLATDENFDSDILRGLLRRQPDLDVVRVQDVGLAETADEKILAWAAGEQRVLLTHDRDTIPNFAYDRVRGGEPMAG